MVGTTSSILVKRGVHFATASRDPLILRAPIDGTGRTVSAALLFMVNPRVQNAMLLILALLSAATCTVAYLRWHMRPTQ